MAIERYSWNSSEDWKKGQFEWTSTSNPPGFLSVGWSQTLTGGELFLYEFSLTSGSSVKNKVDEREEAQISGSYSWKQSGSGARYITLSGGSVTIPGNANWPLQTVLVGVTFRVSEYPTSDMLLIGQNSSSSLAKLYLNNDGRVFLSVTPGTQPIISKKRVPKNRVSFAGIVFGVNSDRVVAVSGILNGEVIGTNQDSNLQSIRINNAGFAIGPGNMDLFNCWMAKTQINEALELSSSGKWISEVCDLGEVRRVTAISVDGYISDYHKVEVGLVMSDREDFANTRSTEIKVNEASTVVLPNLIYGRFFKVAVALSGNVFEDTPFISELCLHLSDYPFAAPIAIPSVVAPEDDLGIICVPQQEAEITVSDTLSPNYVKTTAEETDATVTVESKSFSRKIRPIRGWREFGRQSTRFSLSQHKISPPVWYLGPLLTATEIHGQPLVSEKGVILSHGDSCWFAWDGWGKELWFRSDPYPIRGEGVLTDKLLIWPTTNDVRAADLRDGSLVWVYGPESPPSGLLAILENGHVLVPLENGKLDLISVLGTLVKQINPGFGAGTHVDEAYSDVPYSEAYHGDVVAQYIPHGDHSDYDDYTDNHRLGGGSYSDRVFPIGPPPYIDCVATPVKCRRDVYTHADIAHADVAHVDSPHSDSIHSDIAYKDVTVSEAEGKGVVFTDEGMLEEILLVFPTFATVVNQDSEVISIITGGSKITAAVINDEIAEENKASTIRLVHAGFKDGTIGTFSADSGAQYFQRTLDSEVKFVLNAPVRGVPIVVGTKKKIYLLQQNLDSLWEKTIPSEPSGWPVCTNEAIIISLTDRLWILDYNGVLVNEVITQETLTGTPTLMKPGTILVPSERGVLVFGSFSRAPFVLSEIWPEFVHSNEDFYLLDRSTEIFGEIKASRWFVAGNQLDGKIQKSRISNPGRYEVNHIIANDLGQRGDERRFLRVYPSFVEERPVLWKMEWQSPRRMAITVKPEDEMRIFYPDEGISEVYQDQSVQIDLEIFGEMRDITGSDVVFILKDSEQANATELLRIDGEITDAENGKARITVLPTDWKKLTGDSVYFWGIYVSYPSGRTELAGRGRIDLRAALA